MPELRVFCVAVLAALAVFPVTLHAQQGGAGNDPIVARVNGEDIHRSEVMEMARALPAQYQTQLVQIYPLLVERLIDFRLVGAVGRAAGLAEDAEVKARVAKAEEQAIRDVYIERAIAARVTDEGLQARYQEFLTNSPPVIEHHARHILVESEDEARAVIAELDEGADFAELAKKHSTGPTGAQGGDLGFFTKDQMVPEFSEATAGLEPGQYTSDPTKTQFGWHVIKLEDRRTGEPPEFAEVEQKFREEMAREAVEAVFSDLREGAKIEILPSQPAPAGGTTQ